jgi:hypothetical protein
VPARCLKSAIDAVGTFSDGMNANKLTKLNWIWTIPRKIGIGIQTILNPDRSELKISVLRMTYPRRSVLDQLNDAEQRVWNKRNSELIRELDVTLRHFQGGAAIEDDDISLVRGLFQQIFRSPLDFSYLLMEGQLNARFQSLNLGGDLVKVLLGLDKIAPTAGLMDLYPDFCGLVSAILSEPPESVHHLRALALIFLFPWFLRSPEGARGIVQPLMEHIVHLPHQILVFFLRALTLSRSLTVVILHRCDSAFLQFTPSDDVWTFLTSLLDGWWPSERTRFHRWSALAARFGSNWATGSSRPALPDSAPDADEVPLDLDAHFPDSVDEPGPPHVSFRDDVDEPRLTHVSFPDRGFEPPVFLTVDRDRLAESALSALKTLSSCGPSVPFQIHFAGEVGLDLDGLTAEFLARAAHAIFTPEFGMFEIVEDMFYWFNPDLSNPEDNYERVGVLLGLACSHRIPLPIKLPRCLYRKLLDRPFEPCDLAELAPQVAASLEQLFESREHGDDVADAGLTFAAGAPFFPGGEDVDVTNDNLEQYVQGCMEYYLHGQFAPFIDLLVSGFRRFCPLRLCEPFDPSQLALRVEGQKHYDWTAFQNAAKYRLDDVYPCVGWFWEVFTEFSEDEKMHLLQFVTGHAGIPPGGFASAPIRINVNHRVDLLPTAHVCFRTLELPNYPSKEELRAKLRISIQYPTGFGMV